MMVLPGLPLKRVGQGMEWGEEEEEWGLGRGWDRKGRREERRRERRIGSGLRIKEYK
jgi:hypothetical protein